MGPWQACGDSAGIPPCLTFVRMTAAAAVTEASPPPCDVMVVEDDFAIRETLRELLEEEGYRVAWASNGDEALTQLRRGTFPGLILLDLMMPVMDGTAFRSALRLDPELAGIPVVVISADSGLEEKASTMAVDGYLAKPFDLVALLDTVRRCAAIH
jgi:CheY-like chemotaxis protein